MAILSLQKVTKSFVHGQGVTTILKNATFSLLNGKIYSLVGPSGCGKSTLLHIAGLLERPTNGKVLVDGTDCTHLSEDEATHIRGTKIGFVYQSHHLLPEFNALENVMMPLMIMGVDAKQAKEEASKLLEEFSLGHRAQNLPTELSGGEQQRIAIARALIHKPQLLLADEPTGNLDEANAAVVFEQFLKITRQKKVCVLMVTHNLELAKKTDKILSIYNGVVKVR